MAFKRNFQSPLLTITSDYPETIDFPWSAHRSQNLTLLTIISLIKRKKPCCYTRLSVIPPIHQRYPMRTLYIG